MLFVLQGILQGILKSFQDAHWYKKIYWIPPIPLWNATTTISIPIEGIEVAACSTAFKEGYSCVPNSQCLVLFNLLDSIIDSDTKLLVCEDSSQTCCHESKQLEAEEFDGKKVELCSTLATKGTYDKLPRIVNPNDTF